MYRGTSSSHIKQIRKLFLLLLKVIKHNYLTLVPKAQLELCNLKLDLKDRQHRSRGGLECSCITPKPKWIEGCVI